MRRTCLRSRFARPLAFLFLCLLFCSPALEARRWTTVNGQTFEGEFVRLEGANAIFRVKEREDPYPVNLLSAPDRLFINKAARDQSAQPAAAAAPADSPLPEVAQTPAAPAPATSAKTSLQFAGQPLKEGARNVVEIAIGDAALLKTIKESYGKPSTKAQMLLAIPAGFDPGARTYPLLIVSSTADGKASSIGSAKANYLPNATAKGYVVMATDGEFGKPEHGDSPDFRWALVAASLEVLYKEWPSAKTWPIATGGVSGGGGYASHQAMILLDKQYPFMGIFLAITTHTPGDFPDVLRRAPRAALRTLPVFLSAGEKDTVATPKETEGAHAELTKAGFKNVRFEKFPGGHQIHRPHLEAALDWFLAEYKTKSPKAGL